MKPRDAIGHRRLLLLLLSFATLLSAQEQRGKFVLDSLRNRDRQSILTPFQPEERFELEKASKLEVVKEPEPKPKFEPKPKLRPKPKPKPTPPPVIEPKRERVVAKPPEAEVLPRVYEEPERKRPYAIIGLIMSGALSALLFLLIIVHLIKRESSYQRRKVFGYVKEKNRIEEDVRSLQEMSKGLEREIERRMPREVADSIKSGRLAREIAQVISAAIEPRIREMVVVYQEIKKALAELDREVEQLQAIKNISFKELARQTASEFWRPLQNEFSKTRLSFEKSFSDFEEREDGRLSSLDKRYGRMEAAIAEVSRRLIALDSIVTSATSFAGEPLIRTPKLVEEEKEGKKDRTALNNYIYKLADDGLTIDEIAQKTKIGKGEIKLILDLRAKSRYS